MSAYQRQKKNIGTGAPRVDIHTVLAAAILLGKNNEKQTFSMKLNVFIASAVATTSFGLIAPLASHAVDAFTGPWDPSGAPLNSPVVPGGNGFNRAVQSIVSTFTVSVSPDKQTITALLSNNGDTSHPSFFLENYSGLLPAVSFSYNYSITLNSLTGFVTEFDDFGNSVATYASGTILSGTTSGLNPNPSLPYPYFGYFGININDGAGSAEATVVLTNFHFTSVPGPLPIAGFAAAFGFSRRLRARLKATAVVLRS